MLIVDKLLQPWKAEVPMVGTPLPMVTEVRLGIPWHM